MVIAVDHSGVIFMGGIAGGDPQAQESAYASGCGRGWSKFFIPAGVIK